MNFINSILRQIPGISKSQRNFLSIILETILAVPGKINFRNLSRFCKYSEKTISRNYRKPIAFLELNLKLINKIVARFEALFLLAIDCSFISKSGKKTYGIGRYFNGSKSRAEKGLEIFMTSLVAPALNTAFALRAYQTIPDAGINKKKGEIKQNNQTRINYYLQCLEHTSNFIKTMVKYCVADGYFAKSKFVEGVRNMGLHFICKLRNDANLKFLYNGKQKERGRKRKFADKVVFDDLRKFKLVKKLDNNTSLYTAIVYNVNLKCKIRIALIVCRHNNKRSHIILFSTDLELSADKIYAYYKSRFQIEFVFRDAKQHTGLCDCQSTKKESLDFHFNASLTALNVAKIEALENHSIDEKFIFSMASVKRRAYNENLMKLIFSNSGFKLSLIKFQSVFKKFRNYGTIAA
jgi:hypothetical protein